MNSSVVKRAETRWRGLSGRRRDLLADIAVVVACGVVDLTWAYGAEEVEWTFAATGLLAVRRKFPSAVAVLVASIDVLAPGSVFAAVFCALVTVGSRARVVPGTLAAVATSAGFAIPLWDDEEPFSVTVAASGMVLQIVLPLAVGVYLRHSRQMVAMQRDQAVARERDRIAREMHDVLGHKLSLIALHAGKLELTGTDTETARLLGGTSRAAMRDLRQIIGVLDAQPATVAELIESSCRAGLRVKTALSGDLNALPPEVSDAVRRVVQEALTNVHKHAGPVDVVVEFEVVRSRPRLTVRNSPPARRPETHGTGTGRGLATLAAEVRTRGGQLSWGPQDDGGFAVTAVFEQGVDVT
ncbi:histidine kinase [Lentzea sp. NPDC004782]|uniref:sensor histidine kinase n=1 Tax=Lentzea sp. NPDC004782 TaxID=3154458 RepID=UPI0033B64A15